MKTEIIDWFKENMKSRRDWGVALTALTPIALVIGRAPADWAVSIVAVLFLFDSIICHRLGWVKQTWVIAALVLWGYSVVRATFIPDGGAGLFAAFVWLRYIVFAASLANWALAEEKNRLWLLYSIIGTVLFLSVDGLIQYYFGRDIFGHSLFNPERLTGPYSRPILGITIANLFAPVIFWLLDRKQILKSVMLANICFAAVFLSGDRMGLALAAVIMLTWFFFLVRVSTKRVWVIVANVCFLAVLAFFSPNHIERQIQSTAETAGEISSSPYGHIWKSAIDLGKANPVFGVGMKQFRFACLDERFGPVVYNSDGYSRCHTHPHNAYMEWFSEGGLIGLFGFTGFVLIVGVRLGRQLLSHKADIILWGLAAMLGVRLMPLFVSTSFFNNWSAIPFWLALGWAMSYRTSSPERKTVP